jgi:phytoene synthase
MAAETAADDIAYLTALVRASDRPRYYATLFAPPGRRADLFALYGFAAEIGRVPEQVSEPALGEIRLRWWQEALAGAAGEDGGGSTPALRAVSDIIVRHSLPLAAFDALIEARSADLYSDSPATLADVEGRMGETESVLFQMAAIILGAAGPETADAAGHAGIAYGLARRLASFASDRARGRTIVPGDFLARENLTPADLFAATSTHSLGKVAGALVDLARRHLDLARTHAAKLPKPLRSAFLPLAVVAPLLRRAEHHRYKITIRDALVSDLETLLRIGLAHLRG